MLFHVDGAVFRVAAVRAIRLERAEEWRQGVGARQAGDSRMEGQEVALAKKDSGPAEKSAVRREWVCQRDLVA